MEEMNCKFCGESVQTHKQLLCPVCNKPWGCDRSENWITNHIRSKDCSAQFCVNCGWVDGVDHYAECDFCHTKYSCFDGTCPQGCCSTCGNTECHCSGACGAPMCVWYQQYHEGYPQHSKKSLKGFGLLVNGEAVDLISQARTFYATLALRERNPAVAEEIFHELAEYMAHAILCACAGELRYATSSMTSGVRYLAAQTRKKHNQKQLDPVLERTLFGIRWLYSRPYGMGDYAARLQDLGHGGRTGSAIHFLSAIYLRYGMEHAARLLANGFKLQSAGGKSGGGYGGPLWGQAAALLHKWAKGDINDVVFLDGAFNLQHNGGALFTKTHRLPMRMKEWLDKRVEYKPQDIIQEAPNWVLEAFGQSLDRKTCSGLDAVMASRPKYEEPVRAGKSLYKVLGYNISGGLEAALTNDSGLEPVEEYEGEWTND